MRRPSGFTRRALSMTPLIDIIFLLLLFFMLTSTFTRFAEVPLVQAARGSAPAPDPETRLFIRLSDAGATINGADAGADMTRAMVARLNGEDAIGLLSVDRDASSQRFVEVLNDLRGIDGLRVAVLR